MGVLSVNKIRLRNLVKRGSKRARVLEELLKDRASLITAILIGTNLANTACVSLTTSFFYGNAFWATLGVSALILLFGEIVPKALFFRHATYLALILSYPLKICYYLFLPAVQSFRLFNRKGQKKPPLISRSQLKLIILEGEKEGSIKKEKGKMLSNIFELSQSKVRDVMTPRVEMALLREKAKIDEILDTLSATHHSRVPVYKDSIDEITGILYAKDILTFKGKRERLEAKDLSIRPYFVPESMPVARLLSEFRKRKVHIAVVVDEYGGTHGLVTLEDLLEEIVGEIEDEHDQQETPIKISGPNSWVVEGNTEISHLNEKLNLGIEAGEFETISGLLLEKLGQIPKLFEQIKYSNLKMTVVKADEKRILKVKIEKEKEDEE